MITLRNRHLFFLDAALLPVAAILAFALRLDATGLQRYGSAMLLFTLLAVPLQLLVSHRLGLYNRLWRYASVDELLLIGSCAGLSTLIIAALLFALALPLSHLGSFPRSVPFIDGLLVLFVLGSPRFAYRLMWRHHHRARRRDDQGPRKRVLVVGAGDAGTMIVQEMHDNPQVGLVPVGFLDDDEEKHGIHLCGLPVLGGRDQLPGAVRSLDAAQVIIAMPTAPGAAIRDILAICEAAGVSARTVPGIYDILAGEVSISHLREVDIEDLLRREPVQTDISAVEAMLRGTRVLVTGAGGSIGSELCRQIARCGPAELVLLGHGENSIYGIHTELRRTHTLPRITPVIADLRDAARLELVFATHRPQVVFHAAAHKHVPLMEANACEAVTNNVLGTRHLLNLAGAYGVGRFVLISTDKAVNPTSVMGTTKRVAELLVQQAAAASGRPYAAVRFGNVLDSRGSVVPLFRQQIAAGGPVTVTHPDVRRYFMTIPEAVQLVLQAATLGRGGEVFLLDMGEPVRIVDLARDLIELSGLEVDRDVCIEYTGLRPGEKLFEELFVDGEEYRRTSHRKIFVSLNRRQGPCCPVDLDPAVASLIDLARRGDEAGVRAELCHIVPEYEAPEGCQDRPLPANLAAPAAEPSPAGRRP